MKNIASASPMLCKIFAYPFFHKILDQVDEVEGVQKKTTNKKSDKKSIELSDEKVDK